jgi:hypothetical protein
MPLPMRQSNQARGVVPVELMQYGFLQPKLRQCHWMQYSRHAARLSLGARAFS